MRKFSLFLNLRKITCVKQSLTASVHTKRSLARTGGRGPEFLGEGEQGLKDYSSVLSKVGTLLKAFPLTSPLGNGLSFASDAIDTGLDFKNKDIKTATENTLIRGVFFGLGKGFEKSLDKVQSNLPKSLGNETTGERAVKLGVDIGLDKAKGVAIDKNSEERR